jgi:RNA polymerase sigma-70 factor (ECF subfamily)
MPRIDDPILTALFRRARAERWNVSPDAFRSALERSLPDDVGDAAQIERRLEALHLEDLALACGCAAGDEAAWEHFVLTFRPVLYRSAAAIDPSGGARDLADSLYAELFGLAAEGGDRKSLFRYFQGRSSLATWLRAVLSQRHVDRIRADKRWEPLPEADATPAPSAGTPDPDRGRFAAMVAAALQSAVEALVPRDRLRLAWYYAHDMTLAEIGRALGEHEATVSRNLSKARRQIREHVEHQLGREHGLGPREIAECLASAAGDTADLDLRDVLGPAADRKNLPLDRSTNEGLP